MATAAGPQKVVHDSPPHPVFRPKNYVPPPTPPPLKINSFLFPRIATIYLLRSHLLINVAEPKLFASEAPASKPVPAPATASTEHDYSTENEMHFCKKKYQLNLIAFK
jgi:hypothetical protein